MEELVPRRGKRTLDISVEASSSPTQSSGGVIVKPLRLTVRNREMRFSRGGGSA
jgi:hypothetical protein